KERGPPRQLGGPRFFSIRRCWWCPVACYRLSGTCLRPVPCAPSLARVRFRNADKFVSFATVAATTLFLHSRGASQVAESFGGLPRTVRSRTGVPFSGGAAWFSGSVFLPPISPGRMILSVGKRPIASGRRSSAGLRNRNTSTQFLRAFSHKGLGHDP